MNSPARAGNSNRLGRTSSWIVFLAGGSCLLGYGIAWGEVNWGNVKRFFPKYVDYSGDFKVGSRYEWDKTTSSSNPTSKRSELVIQEGLDIQGLGYIYSPHLAILNTSLTLGLRQEQVDNNGERSSYYDGNASQYKQVVKILPSHPYNLELFSLRATPMTGGTSSRDGSMTINEHGATASYAKRPWSGNLSYTNHDSSGILAANNQALLANLHYFQADTSVSGAYHHNIFSSLDSTTEETIRDVYNLNFTKSLKKVRLYSRLSRDQQEERERQQEGEAGVGLAGATSRNGDDEFSGGIDADLPHRFKSSLSFRQADRFVTTSSGQGEAESFSESQSYRFRLHHRLYKSLNTSFSASHQATEARAGDMNQQNYRLASDYYKIIPWGSVHFSLWDGLSINENHGAPVTLFETHTIDLGRNFFTLNFQTIDRDTIQIRIIDSNNHDQTVVLTEGIHYRVDDFATSLRITILNLPFDDLVDPDGNIWDYTYKVDYAFEPANYTLSTKDWGSSLRVPLFNTLVTPHFTYRESDQLVLDGDYPGDPGNLKSHSLGLGFGLKPFSGDVTQSWVSSNSIEEERLTALISFRKEITASSSGSFSLSFEDVDTTLFGIGSFGPASNLEEQFYSAQAQINTALPNKNMNVSLSTNYTLNQGLGETTSMSLASNFTWHIGLMDVNVSASYASIEATFDQGSTQRESGTVRAMLKRKLF